MSSTFFKADVLMTSFGSKMDIEQLFKRGTDIKIAGRFHQTLSYNHFQIEVVEKLRDLHTKLQDVQSSVTEISPNGVNPINSTTINRYSQNFFEQSRDDQYVEEVVTFFGLLWQHKFEAGKTLVLFT